MTNFPLGLIVEGLVAILLMLTIGYCVVLNGRLKRLRSDEEALRATISELITATEIAERAILGLKATANDCDTTISDRLYEAERTSLELAGQIATGEKVLGRITQIADAARPAQDRRTQPTVRHTGNADTQDPAARPEAAQSKPMSAQDLKVAAAEAAARLESFRRRSTERAA